MPANRHKKRNKWNFGQNGEIYCIDISLYDDIINYIEVKYGASREENEKNEAGR